MYWYNLHIVSVQLCVSYTCMCVETQGTFQLIFILCISYAHDMCTFVSCYCSGYYSLTCSLLYVGFSFQIYISILLGDTCAAVGMFCLYTLTPAVGMLCLYTLTPAVGMFMHLLVHFDP